MRFSRADSRVVGRGVAMILVRKGGFRREPLLWNF